MITRENLEWIYNHAGLLRPDELNIAVRMLAQRLLEQDDARIAAERETKRKAATK